MLNMRGVQSIKGGLHTWHATVEGVVRGGTAGVESNSSDPLGDLSGHCELWIAGVLRTFGSDRYLLVTDRHVGVAKDGSNGSEDRREIVLSVAILPRRAPRGRVPEQVPGDSDS